MKRDFTIQVYKIFLRELANNGYTFITFEEYLSTKIPSDRKIVLLRHDVDDRKQNALTFAEIQYGLGIRGTYYFRIGPDSYDEDVIKRIVGWGHEIGYHYEDINFVKDSLFSKDHRKEEDFFDAAWELFNQHLIKFRTLYPVKTISMHGSPWSKSDNKALWKKYDYRSVGVIGEPYFDIDFTKVAYFTDTGRRWNGSNFSIRDKVTSSFNFNFKTTKEIIENMSCLPSSIMFTFHPQRWTDNPMFWAKELVLQNLKNQVKHLFIRK